MGCCDGATDSDIETQGQQVPIQAAYLCTLTSTYVYACVCVRVCLKHKETMQHRFHSFNPHYNEVVVCIYCTCTYVVVLCDITECWNEQNRPQEHIIPDINDGNYIVECLWYTVYCRCQDYYVPMAGSKHSNCLPVLTIPTLLCYCMQIIPKTIFYNFISTSGM